MTISDFISRLVLLQKTIATDTQVHIGKDISETPEQSSVWEYFDIFSDKPMKRIIIAPSDKWDRKQRRNT